MSEKQQILHQAEELGQGRPLCTEEIRALALMAVIAGGWGACAALLLFNAYWLIDHDLSLASLALPALAGLVVGSGAVLVVGGKEVIDGLRSWRKADTFAPPPESKPEPVAIPPPSPIIVKRPDGSSYVLPRTEERPLLPDGRQALGLNEDTLRAVLAEVIERHDGLWSRKRLMAITVGGKRVTRALYEIMTDSLARAGFLQERPTGGFELPKDVKRFDDLALYIPQMVGKAGGQAGRREIAAGRREGPAERARARWLAKEEKQL